MPNPTAKLASFLFKGRRLSQASLELSSSRGVFGSRESERKKRERRERREKIKQNLKIKQFIYKSSKNENLQITKSLYSILSTSFYIFITKHEGYL